MHNEHSLAAKLCNHFLIFSSNKMDNLMKRIVQNELENHGEPPEKKKNQQILDWENFWKRYVEKRNQSIMQLRKKDEFISNGNEEIPFNKWILLFQ